MRPQKNIDDIVHGIDFEHQGFSSKFGYWNFLFYHDWLTNMDFNQILASIIMSMDTMYTPVQK